MTRRPSQPYSLEQALLEWNECEQAGVFARTTAPELVAAKKAAAGQPGEGVRPFKWIRFNQAIGALAACCVLVVGIYKLVLSDSLGDISGRSPMAAGTSTPETIHFSDCLVGPKYDRLGDCLIFDFDRDGDVDLADFSAMQLSSTGITR